MSVRLIVFNFFAILAYATSLDQKIIGGQEAKDGMYPYQVSIQIETEVPGVYLTRCSGVIIHSEWVITAPNLCLLSEVDSKKVIVVAGSNSLYSKPGVTYPVLAIHIHPGLEGIANDVAILKVGPIKFNDKVSKIKIETEHVGGGVPVILTGWGVDRVTLDPETNLPLAVDKLKELHTSTITLENCRKLLPSKNIFNTTKIPKIPVICTKEKQGEGGCYPDSGDPLVQRKKNEFVLIGLLCLFFDKDAKCTAGNIPSIYTLVSAHVGWFNKICKNCLKNK